MDERSMSALVTGTYTLQAMVLYLLHREGILPAEKTLAFLKGALADASKDVKHPALTFPLSTVIDNLERRTTAPEGTPPRWNPTVIEGEKPE